MRFPTSLPRLAAGLLLAVFLGLVGWQVLRWRNSGSPEALLKRADEMAWLNNWIAAEPLYRQAEQQFIQRRQLSKALYARASEMPAHSESSATFPSQIAVLRRDLDLREAQDPETRLRILTILGMIEVNYDSGMARQTWTEVEALAMSRHHYLLASRAIGEQGIAAFLLGDIATAKKDVLKAWMIAKVADPAARIRYASMFGTGLVELHKYKEALGPLDEAIRVAGKTRGAAYPTIAITAKIEALTGLGDDKGALALAAEEMRRVSAYHLAGHLYEIYQTRAGVYERMGQSKQAAADFVQAVQYAKIPDELYFVPRNLEIKAEIMAHLGNAKAANDQYEKSADLLDALLSKVPSPSLERQLLSDLSAVYAGYFASLSGQGRMADAFRAIERARGRVEAQALEDHEVIPPHDPNPAERNLTKLNLELLNTDDSNSRGRILDAIYTTELQLGTRTVTEDAPTPPVALNKLQHDLRADELVVEYVLADPHSYALAVTRDSVRRYTLPPQALLEWKMAQYRSELMQQKTDLALAQQLFDGLLAES